MMDEDELLKIIEGLKTLGYLNDRLSNEGIIEQLDGLGLEFERYEK